MANRPQSINILKVKNVCRLTTVRSTLKARSFTRVSDRRSIPTRPSLTTRNSITPISRRFCVDRTSPTFTFAGSHSTFASVRPQSSAPEFLLEQKTLAKDSNDLHYEGSRIFNFLVSQTSFNCQITTLLCYKQHCIQPVQISIIWAKKILFQLM